jgi:hypothetical protein
MLRDDGKQSKCAVKKMRVSLRICRPALEHESRVLHLVRGHVGIPKLLAYGRFPHFEYMAMELLGPTVQSKVVADHGASLSTVLLVADQMVRRELCALSEADAGAAGRDEARPFLPDRAPGHQAQQHCRSGGRSELAPAVRL